MSDGHEFSMAGAGVVPARVVSIEPPRTPGFGFVLAVWWSGAWRWLLASLLLCVPFGLLGAWYLYRTGFDFIAWSMTGAGMDRFISAVWWLQFCVHVPTSVWALRAALWRHGIVKGR